MRRILAALVCVGCGGIEGEPIEGTIAMQYGDSAPELVVGAVVQDENVPEEMLVQIGSDNVDCDTYLDTFFSFNTFGGHFVYFSVPKVPGTNDMAFVSAMRSEDDTTKINTSQGVVTIDTVEPRVTGTVTFDTTDEEVGEITVSGSFDVLRCF
jgi:hypothetical protein